MIPEALDQSLASLPDSPGVYRFYHREQLIYIGKAKNLKKRVSSYFSGKITHQKTVRMVSEITRLEFTLCQTEYDALLLENNLIKQNQPKYNILLRDDKTFPYVCITREPFPRLLYTRRRMPEWGEYFGPFTSVTSVKQVLELIHQLYPIRTCALPLTEESIKKNKFKICLEYHLKNCKGPCEGFQRQEEYRAYFQQIRPILKGNLSEVEKILTEQMRVLSSELKFEEADIIKQKIQLLERYHAKATAVNPSFTDLDVMTITSDEQEAYINYMKIKEGAIIFTTNLNVTKKLDETNEEILARAVETLRSEYESNHVHVYTNIPLSIVTDAFTITVPQAGDKRKLIEMSLENALFLRNKKIQEREKQSQRMHPGVMELKVGLRLPEIPRVMECFDNSNWQGDTPVAAMTQFLNGKPNKKEYRHFHIRTVIGPNDFASMKEIVTRRYKRLMDEKQPLPQLVVIDGGKGQLSSACEALKELGLYGKMSIIGIAKKLEELYFPDDPIPLHLNRKSPGLLLLQHLRDETHRFAIEFHRLSRSKKYFISELEEWDGIGKKTAEKLLAHFKSLKQILAASPDELEQVVGKKVAEKIIAKQREQNTAPAE